MMPAELGICSVNSSDTLVLRTSQSEITSTPTTEYKKQQARQDTGQPIYSCIAKKGEQ